MARSSTRRRSRGRSSRRHPRSRVLMVLAIIVALLYFTFTRVFFDPFEAGQLAFELLSPRDVDVFVKRQALATDFVTADGLPIPRVWDRLRRTAQWKVFEQSTWWQALDWPRELEAAVSELGPHLAELPLDPLEHVLGSEVVLLGRDVGGSGEWALLARLSNSGKMAVELLDFDSVLQGAWPGAVRETVFDEDMPEVHYTRVTLASPSERVAEAAVMPSDGATGLAPAGSDAVSICYAREADLLVVGQGESLVRDVLRLAHGGSELAVGLSRLYGDHMPRAPADATTRFSAGFKLALGRLLEVWELLPSAEVQRDDALANLLLRLVDTGVVRDAVGRLELAPGSASLRLHGEIDVGRAASDEGGLLGSESFSVHDQLGKLMNMVPRDVAVALTLNVSLRRFLTTVSLSFSPDVRALLDGTLREVAAYTAGWQIDTLPELVTELGRALGGRVSLVVRPLDHVIPQGSQPLPAMALMVQVSSLPVWNTLEDVFLRAHDVFGVSSDRMKELDEGVGKRRWLTLVNQPLEEIAYVVLDGETLVLATDNDLLAEIVAVYTGMRQSLGSTPAASALLREFRRAGPDDARANAAGWLSASGLRSVLEPYGAYLAEAGTVIDFGVERARQRKQLIARNHPEYKGREAELPEDVVQALDKQLDRLIDEQEAKRRAETVPELARAWAESLQWLTLLEQAALGLRLGDRSLDLELRLVTVGG